MGKERREANKHLRWTLEPWHCPTAELVEMFALSSCKVPGRAGTGKAGTVPARGCGPQMAPADWEAHKMSGPAVAGGRFQNCFKDASAATVTVNLRYEDI